jgi:hypothetical protein
MEKKASVTNFSEINSPQDLIAYLSDSANRLENTKNKTTQYVYHYTKLSNVVSIINSRSWWLNSPKTMNDGLEFQNISEFEQRSAVFFASFMYDSNESIAMWSMYAQPWEDGVFIRIPVEVFKKWIRNTKTIYPVFCPENQNPALDKSAIPYEQLSVVRVAYTNADSVQYKSEEILICGKAENKQLKNTPHLPDLVGYVKDLAWEYEHEVRVLATMAQNIRCDRLAIGLPDDLIDSMKIVAGPRFSGNLSERIRQEVHRQFTTNRSLFSDKLNWIPCDSCPEKSKCDNCPNSKII